MNSIKLALDILRETADRLLKNWGAVLRICALPLLLPTAILSLLTAFAVKNGQILRYLPANIGGQGELPILGLVLALLAAAGTYPVAVRWHRFELMGEQPAWLETRFHVGASFGYFGRTILLTLWIALVGFFLSLPMILLADKLGGSYNFSMGELPNPPSIKNFFLSAIFFALINAAFFRFAMILPARAFGLNMTFGESKDGLSKIGFQTLFWIGLFFHLGPLALNLLIGELHLGAFGAILMLPFLFLFWLMFGVAVLTRLYDRSGLPLSPATNNPPDEPFPIGPRPMP